MHHTNAARIDQHADDVEPVFETAFTVPIDPDRRRMGQVSPLPHAHGAYRTAKAQTPPSLDFDKCDRVATPNNEIDIPVPHLEPARDHDPSATRHPPRGQ